MNKGNNNSMSKRREPKNESPKKLNKARFELKRKVFVRKEEAAEEFYKCLRHLENNTGIVSLEELYLYFDLPTKTFYKLIKDFEICRDIHDRMKAVIAVRRERGVFDRRYESGFISKTMSAYSKTWRDLEEWRSALQQKANTPDKDTLKEAYLEFMRDYNAKV